LDHAGSSIGALLSATNQFVYDEMRQDASLLGMGATVAGVAVRGDIATIFNVGDARVYQMADACLMLVTTDDRSSPGSNVVTQSLGGAERRTDVSPHMVDLAIAPGHKMLICSDGLSEVVDFECIQSVLAEEGGPAAPSRLLQLALDRGAPDNVSIITLELDDE
jgi:protein phosphatase